jgi:hypothetical protein
MFLTGIDQTEEIIRQWTLTVRFFPTLGSSWRGVIPTALSSVLLPIPECKRMVGVMMEPAERITSLAAVML